MDTLTGMADRKPLRDILVKPAGPDCNMGCTYCFYSSTCSLFGDTKTHRMSRAVLEEMIRQVMAQSGGEVSIGWQGGEPTLMGREFFETAVGLETRFGRGKVVGNGLQTNGILIDRAWARFFKQYSFLIGLSIDGPEHVHDHYRLTKRGKGSWSRVTDSARLMLNEGVSVNALTVVNDYSARFPREIYEFHKGLGLTYMQFIPCVEMDPERPGTIAAFSVSPEDYGLFLCAVFDLWRSDFVDGVPTTSIRFFESLLFAYAGFPVPECTLAGECGPYVVVEHNGDVYSCDFFVDPSFRLGNIMEGSLSEMLNSPDQRRFGKQKADLPQSCSACEWVSVCRGGCTKDRVHNPSDAKANYLCGGFKVFFAHADADLRQLVAEWRKRQGDRY
jgi:uncharacterized protein